MTIGTITINSVNYVVYATREEVNAVLFVDPVRSDLWNALTDDDETRGPFIVAATRRLTLLSWQGTKTGDEDTQIEAWPITGLSYPNGTPVTTTDAPLELVRATALLSGSINISAAVANEGSSSSNIKGVKAGSAAVDFFRAQAGKPLQDETAFKLIQQWLEAASTSGALGPLATGTDGVDTFEDIDQWGRIRGFP